MKYLIILLATFSFNIFSADTKKLDPIIFMLDLSIVEKLSPQKPNFLGKSQTLKRDSST